MVKRMTKTNIACGVIPNPNWKGKFIIEMITNMREPYIICSDIQILIDRTLHLLLGHSNSNWKRQFSIEMISKMTEPCILYWDIQVPTEKDSSVSKWLYIWQNFTSFEGKFRSQLKRQFVVTKMRETNILCGDISIPKWRRQFSIEMIPKMTVPYILCGDIQIPIDRTSHFLLGHSDSNWKEKQFSIKMISKMTELTSDPVWGHSNSKWEMQFTIEMTSKISELHILCGSIQIKTEEDSLVLKWLQRWQNLTFIVGTFKFQLTEPYILFWEIQISTEKDSGLSKWLQWWQNFTFFVGTFKFQLKKDSSVFKWFQIWRNLTSFVRTFIFQLKKTVQYWNDYKDDRTLHSLWGHSNSDWKNSSLSKWFQRSQNFTSSVGTFKFQLKEKTV